MGGWGAVDVLMIPQGGICLGESVCGARGKAGISYSRTDRPAKITP